MDLGSMYSIFQGSNPFASLCAHQNTQRPFAKTIVWQLTRSFIDFKDSFSNKKEFPWSNMCTPLKTNTNTQTSHVYTPFQSIHTFGSILIMFIFQGVHLSNLAINPLWIPTRVLQKSFFESMVDWLWRCQKMPVNSQDSLKHKQGTYYHLFYWYCWWFRHLPNHLGCIKPSKKWWSLQINWCKISSTNSSNAEKNAKGEKTPTLSPKWTSVFLPQPKHLGVREKLHTEVR